MKYYYASWGCSSAGEHLVRNEGAEGSNPFTSTITLCNTSFIEINYKYLTFFSFMPYNHWMKKIIIIFLAVLFLSSCSYLPFTEKEG